MKITAFIGSTRKRLTHLAVERMLQNLKSFGNVECEIVRLSDYKLEMCKSCLLCFDRGKEFCPSKDDRDKLIEKIDNSDGIILASPNYAFGVSASMKNFIDRLAYNIHRPCFFGKVCTSIVAQAIYGGGKIVRYLDDVMSWMGFNVVKGCYVTALDPISEKERKVLENTIDKLSKRFYSKLVKKDYPSPSLFKLAIFRLTRTGIKTSVNVSKKDNEHYREKGWVESDYFYPVKLGPFKKLFGNIVDLIGEITARRS